MDVSTATAASALHSPRTLIFVVCVWFFLGLTVIAASNDGWSLSRQRRLYWTGTAGAAVCAFLAGLPDWSGGLIFALGTAVILTVTAYFLGSFIKVGDRIWALHLRDELVESGESASTPRGAYGGVITAARLWWLLVVGIALCAINIADRFVGTDEKTLGLPLLAAVVVVLFALGYGYLDGAAGHLVARRQYLQFMIISVVTLGAFAALYLLTYLIGVLRYRRNGGRQLPQSRHARP